MFLRGFFLAINVCVAGSGPARESFCKEAGKKGSSDDFTFYNTSYQGRHVHFIEPTGYPAKLDALFDALALADLVVFVVDEVNAEFGEQVVLLDLYGMEGIIVSDLDLSQFLKGTALEKWRVMGKGDARNFALGEFAPAKAEGAATVLVDHAFEVKGVGSVLLGVVSRGEIRAHQKLVSYPLGKELEIRSIQMNDVDEKAARSSDRVGLSIKGLTSRDVHRGEVLCSERLEVVSELPARIEYAKFAQRDSRTLHAFHCLESAPCRLQGERLVLEKPLALVPGEPVILCDLNRKMRAVGRIGP
jgi:selenocysteine-specific translation elongation factor